MLMKRPMANAFHKWKSEVPDEVESSKVSPRQAAHSRSRAREERRVGIECLVSDILNASQRTSTAYYEQQVNGLETAPGVRSQRSKSPVQRPPSNIGRIGSNGSTGRIGSNGCTSSASSSHVRLRIRAEAFQHQPDLTMVQTTVHRRGDAVKHGLEKVAGEEHHQNAEQASNGDARQDGADTAPSATQHVLYAAERPASGSRHNRLEATAHVVSKLKHWQWMAHLRQALVSWEAAQRDAIVRRITLLSSDLSGRRNTTRHERWLEAWQEETFKLFNTFSTLETDPEIPACLDSAAFVALLSRTGAIEGAISSPSTAEVQSCRMLMSIYLTHALSHTRLHAIILLHALPDNPVRSRLRVSCALAHGLVTQRPATDTSRELSRDQALEFMRRVLVPKGTKELSHSDFVAVLHLICNHFEQEHQIKMQNAVHIDPNSTPAGSETWRERRQHIDGRDRINRLGSDALQSLSRLGRKAQQPSHPARPQSCGGRTPQSAPSTSKTLTDYVPRLGLEWASILAPPKVEQPSCSREGCPNSVPYTVHVDESGSSVITALAQVSCSSCSEQYCSQACQRAAWSQGHKKTCLRKALHRLHATPLGPDLHTTPPSSPLTITTPRRPHTARPAVFYSIPPVFGGKKASSTMSVQAGIAAQRCPSGQGVAAAANGASGDAAHSELFEDVAEWESRFLPRRQSRSRLSTRRAASAAPARSSTRDVTPQVNPEP